MRRFLINKFNNPRSKSSPNQKQHPNQESTIRRPTNGTRVLLRSRKTHQDSRLSRNLYQHQHQHVLPSTPANRRNHKKPPTHPIVSRHPVRTDNWIKQQPPQSTVLRRQVIKSPKRRQQHVQRRLRRNRVALFSACHVQNLDTQNVLFGKESKGNPEF